MTASIELQVLSKLLTASDESVINRLLEFDDTYYSIFKPHIQFILSHYRKYKNVPDIFTFQSKFPDVTLVTVTESLDFLLQELRNNKKHIILLETFNKIRDLGSDDVDDAWKFLSMQCARVDQLNPSQPMDIVKDAKLRSDQIIEFNQKARIPTGFPEIDKLMYGGLSTVEELVIILARTNTGKSWMLTRMMESAQKNGFPVLYYSPEMQSSFLGTRFDTWRGHFQNSKLHQGKYTDQYIEYISQLSQESTPAFIVEDKDMEDGSVSVSRLRTLVQKHNIKLLIIDGLSYMVDDRPSIRDHEKYKNICGDLFKLSKEFGCAVVVAMQANRETKESKDDKGEPFPNLYNAEGSDHPGRIATQAFALRQVFEKHVLDIRLEKSRNAANQKPVLSYAWDVDNGNCQYLPGGGGYSISTVLTSVPTPVIDENSKPDTSLITSSDDWDSDVEF